MTRLEERLEILARRLKEAPQSVESWLSFAQANFLQGKHFLALTAFEQVKAIAPELSEARLGIVQVLNEIKKYPEALRIFSQYAKDRPQEVLGYLLYQKLQKNTEFPSELKKELNFYQKFVPLKGNLEQALKRLEIELATLDEYIEDLKKLNEAEFSPLWSYAFLQAEEKRRQKEAEKSELKALEKVAVEGDLEAVAVPQVEELVKEEKLPTPLEQQLKELLKTKGVVLAAIFDLNGKLLTKAMREGSFEGELETLLQDSFSSLEQFKTDFSFNYWLLEFDQGILVFYKLGDKFRLFVQGELGTNFGALRHLIEHSSALLLELLSGGV